MSNDLLIFDKLSDIEKMIIADSRNRKIVNDWWKKLQPQLKAIECTEFLKELGVFHDVPIEIVNGLKNSYHQLFLDLLRTFWKNRIKYNFHSIYRLWRSLCVVGDRNLLTYLRVSDLPKDKTLLGSDLLKICYKGMKSLQDYTEWLEFNIPAEARLRELIGLSMQDDIHDKIKIWFKSNHPDKGGNHEIFAEVMCVYEEWKNSTKF